MNLLEAAQLLAAMTLLDPYAKNRSEDEQMAIAQAISDALPKADLAWALAQVQAGMRRGVVPTLPELIAAWREEANRRIDGVQIIPEAPAEIESDPKRWLAWERARREALVEGKSNEDAIASADRQLGVSSTRAQIAAPAPGAGESAKARVIAAIREWDRKQKIEQYNAEHPDDTIESGETK